jgi:hypothetical protein
MALLTSNHKSFFFIEIHAAETYPCIKDLDLIPLQYKVTTAWRLYLTMYTNQTYIFEYLKNNFL